MKWTGIALKALWTLVNAEASRDLANITTELAFPPSLPALSIPVASAPVLHFYCLLSINLWMLLRDAETQRLVQGHVHRDRSKRTALPLVVSTHAFCHITRCVFLLSPPCRCWSLAGRHSEALPQTFMSWDSLTLFRSLPHAENAEHRKRVKVFFNEKYHSYFREIASSRRDS